MLARREHGEKELCRKLLARGFDTESVPGVVAELKQEGLQSDYRFIDSFITSRVNKGSGPIRIVQELRQRGVADELIEEMMQEHEQEWRAQLEAVREKKFGKEIPSSYKEQSSQSRFLQYRGFSSEQIRELFRALDE